MPRKNGLRVPGHQAGSDKDNLRNLMGITWPVRAPPGPPHCVTVETGGPQPRDVRRGAWHSFSARDGPGPASEDKVTHHGE